MRLRLLLASRTGRYLAFSLLALPSAPLFAKTVTLGPVDNQTSICLVAGDTLVVTLPSPIAATYRWHSQLTKSSPLSALQSTATPGTAKAAATQTFRFNAAAAGQAKLVFSFERQQPGAGPGATQTFSVEVSIASGEPASAVLIGSYQGALPCADCTGVQTELRLYAKGKFDFTRATYLNTRTYLGGRSGDQSFTDRGEWAVMKGDAADANATVYALDPGQPEKTQYLLLQPDGASLAPLDRQMRPVEAPPTMSLTLHQVK